MSLLQQACDTYDYAEKAYAGVYEAGKTEPLAPICHAITNARIEITVDAEGNYVQAVEVDEKDAKTIFPVTEDSAGRSGTKPGPHPLCDQLGYYMPINERKYNLYLEQLQEWEVSAYSHPMLHPILKYIKKGTIVRDLINSQVIKINENGTLKDEKAFTRWRVIGIGDEGGACWKNRDLQNAYIKY